MATLVGYWKLDETSGTTLADSVGGNTMTISGTMSNTVPSTKIQFPDPNAKTGGGANNALSSTATGFPTANVPFSFSAWIYQEIGSTETFVLGLTAVSGAQEWYVDVFSNGLVMDIGGGQLAQATGITVSPGAWHHIAYTYDGLVDAWYLDGLPLVTQQATHTLVTATCVQLGTFVGFGGTPGNPCRYDECRFYSGALTYAEVVTLANGQPVPGPAITTQPANTYAASGKTAILTVAATTSGGTLHYQWVLNGSNVGTDSASYTTATLGLGDNGNQLFVYVTDDNATTRSRIATIFVSVAPQAPWLRA